MRKGKIYSLWSKITQTYVNNYYILTILKRDLDIIVNHNAHHSIVYTLSIQSQVLCYLFVCLIRYFWCKATCTFLKEELDSSAYIYLNDGINLPFYSYLKTNIGWCLKQQNFPSNTLIQLRMLLKWSSLKDF